MDKWTEEMEKEYQRKLESFPKSIGKFDPDKFTKREAEVEKWYSSLSPAEKLRHNMGKEVIIL